MERRQFFYLSGLGSTTILAGNLLAACSKAEDEDTNTGTPGGNKLILDLTDPAYSGLKTVGNSLIKNNILIIHTVNDTYQALSKICTHQGCTVGFNGTEIVCPCHGSKFTTAGAVIQGPATLALTKYKTELAGEILTVMV